MEKDLCRGLYTSLFCAIIPALFPYFLPFWYPYILLHFQMFFITLYYIIVQPYKKTYMNVFDSLLLAGKIGTLLTEKVHTCIQAALKQEMIFQIPIHCLIDWSVPTSTTGLCCQSLSKNMSALKHLQYENKYNQCTLTAQSAELHCVSWTM